MHPSKFSAIYVYDDQLGGCIAINSLHSEERRRWSLAHVYGHFLVYRYKPIVLIEDYHQRLPEREHFADHFALDFLMSTSGLVRRFIDILRTKKKITPADLCTLAHFYDVSVAALSRRLEDRKLLPNGTWISYEPPGLRFVKHDNNLSLGLFLCKMRNYPRAINTLLLMLSIKD